MSHVDDILLDFLHFRCDIVAEGILGVLLHHFVVGLILLVTLSLLLSICLLTHVL